MRFVLFAVPVVDETDAGYRVIGMDAHKECPPYGVYTLATVVRGRGHHVHHVDLVAEETLDIARHREFIEQADLVGISATSMAWPAATVVLKAVRAIRADVAVVLGGIHPTMFDRYILQKFPVDFVVRGEGERTLVELIDRLETDRRFRSVPSLTWRDGSGAIVQNPAGPRIPKAELTEFPVADYSTLPAGIYKGLSIESSRGCSFDCSFCSTQYRKSWRPQEPGRFVERLETVMGHLDKVLDPYVHVIDDEFAMNPKRVIAVAQELARKDLEPKLVYDARANDILFEGLVDHIAPYTLNFLIGAECGYDEGLVKIGKGTTTAILERAARVLHRAGIGERADFSFIIGLPWETADEVRKTIRFAGHLHASYGVTVLLQWYYQLPGSRLWDEARREGLVHETMYDKPGVFTTNLYLFRTANRLSPQEILEISEEVASMVMIARLRLLERTDRGLLEQKKIEYRHPEVIDRYFPRESIARPTGGLSNLREIAKPSRGLPVRRMSPEGNRFPAPSGSVPCP